MSRYYWDVNRGQTEFQVVQGTSATSASVEVSVDLTVVDPINGMNKEEVLRALDMIKNNIVKGKWPPA